MCRYKLLSLLNFPVSLKQHCAREIEMQYPPWALCLRKGNFLFRLIVECKTRAGNACQARRASIYKMGEALLIAVACASGMMVWDVLILNAKWGWEQMRTPSLIYPMKGKRNGFIKVHHSRNEKTTTNLIRFRVDQDGSQLNLLQAFTQGMRG
eukprot:35155_1